MQVHKEKKIIKWAEDRGIFDKATPLTQADKTLEEVDELFDAIEAGDVNQVKDAIGDIFVTIVIQANMWGLTMAECIDAAYDEIKDRKGKMVNGQFVKE